MLEVNKLVPLEHRLFLLEDLPKNSICAEIGIFEGTFSQKILEICEPKLLHLIDPYPQEKFYFNRTFLEGNFLLHKLTFEHTNFQNNYFDWVYLDTDHAFASTYSQLRLCYHKVKKGGFITGDDYGLDFETLILAVNMFLKTHKDKVEMEYIHKWQFKIRKIR